MPYICGSYNKQITLNTPAQEDKVGKEIMTNNIIDRSINGLQFNELRDCMQQMIHESIVAYSDQDKSWFKDCTMEEYVHEWQEIWDENDGKVGEGIDTIAHQFVLNDDTRADFESAFEQARDAAYEEALDDAISEIEENDIEFDEIIELDDSLSSDEQELLNAGITASEIVSGRFNEVCGKKEKQGYECVIYDSDNVLDFRSQFADDIYESGYKVTVEEIAKWLGATVMVAYQGSEDFDYINIYYKKI